MACSFFQGISTFCSITCSEVTLRLHDHPSSWSSLWAAWESLLQCLEHILTSSEAYFLSGSCVGRVVSLIFFSLFSLTAAVQHFMLSLQHASTEVPPVWCGTNWNPLCPTWSSPSFTSHSSPTAATANTLTKKHSAESMQKKELF